jgi:hypothetical protein
MLLQPPELLPDRQLNLLRILRLEIPMRRISERQRPPLQPRPISATQLRIALRALRPQRNQILPRLLNLILHNPAISSRRDKRRSNSSKRPDSSPGPSYASKARRTHSENFTPSASALRLNATRCCSLNRTVIVGIQQTYTNRKTKPLAQNPGRASGIPYSASHRIGGSSPPLPGRRPDWGSAPRRNAGLRCVQCAYGWS